jgi:hypothetical protein
MNISASGTIKGGCYKKFSLRKNKRRLDRIVQTPEQ